VSNNLIRPKLITEYRQDIDEDFIGYYAVGHWDRQSFAIACHKNYGIDDIVILSEVILGWASRCHCEDDEPDDEYNCWDYHELKTQESVRPVTYWLRSKR
jgi:hypothetical protein